MSERIAIVHDSFGQSAEAELIVEEIARMLPRADLLSADCVEAGLSSYIRSRTPKTSWLNHLPGRERFYRQYTFLHPWAIRGLDLSRYSIVISSCVGFAKSAACGEDAIHVCYCHTPTRALWRYGEYARTEQLNKAAGLMLTPLRAGLRIFDVDAARHPDYYVAKSSVVANEIKRCYRRNALVIHPPVDTSRYVPSRTRDDYYLVVSRLLKHKRIDFLIAACNSTGARLVIVGEGPDKKRLESLAGPTVTMPGNCSETEIAELLRHCQAVFCTDVDEDFDAMPLKANASGRLAISFAAGSVRETVADGKTGVLYEEYSRPAIVDAMRRCSAVKTPAEELRSYSKEFDRAAFRQKFATMLTDILGTRMIRPAIA